MAETDHERKTRQRRFTETVKSPYLALERGWFQDPAFCEGFFDRCEDQALQASPAALDLAQRAVHFAESHGDPHLVHRSYGVLAHAHIARGDRFWAGKTLAGYREQALACCPLCRSDFFRRDGDLLGEERKAAESILALNRCLEEGGRLLGDDAVGRRLFLRSISYHHAGQRDRALADAGEALRLISLDSPRGFFHDTIACIVIYIVGGDPSHDALARQHLDGISRRIEGRKDWKPAHTRLFWANAHVLARLGEVQQAGEQMDAAFRRILKDGLLREALGATLDHALLKCRPSALRNDSLHAAQLAIGRCLDKRADLADDHRTQLKEMKRVLKRQPEDAFRVLRDFRRSFIAPVPSGLADRIGPQ